MPITGKLAVIKLQWIEMTKLEWVCRLDLFVLGVLQMIQEKKKITFEIFGLWPATL